MVYTLPLLITIVIYFLICRKLWLRKILRNVTDRNRAAAEKAKRKVVRLLVITCVVFAVCWFPVYVNHYFWYVRPGKVHLLPIEVQFVFAWIANANSAINPCLYILFNDKFRTEFFDMFTCCPFLRNCRPSFSRSSSKSDFNRNSTTRFRFTLMGRSSAYTLPRSLTEKRNGKINLSLSWASLKDGQSPPNSPPAKSAHDDTTKTADANIDVAM